MNSQPIDPKIAEKMGFSKELIETEQPQKIKLQRIGYMFDDIEGRQVSLTTRFCWKWQSFKYFWRDIKRTIRNHFKWHNTLRELYQWDGCNGLFIIMRTHLRDYQ